MSEWRRRKRSRPGDCVRLISPKRNAIIEICLDTRAWRLTTPHVSLLNEVDVDRNVLGLEEAFEEAIEAASSAGDSDTFDELMALRDNFDKNQSDD